MLGLWLLVFAVGVVNACVLRDGRPGDSLAAMGSVQWVHQGINDPRSADEGRGSADAQQDCLNFCDKVQDTAIKAKVQIVSDDDSSTAPGITWLRQQDARPTPAVQRRIAPPSPPGPPLAILFLRLTI